jgi:subfamily B ATP-binding cassette protein HlyB/CyaB
VQTALTCPELVARLNQVDSDTRAIVRQYGIGEQELSAPELARIAKNLGFKAKLKRLPIDRLPLDYPLPAIYLAKDGSFGVLLKVNPPERKLLAFLPSEKSAQDLTFDRFRELATDTLIVMSPKLLSDQVRFGFKWFFAEILKYRQVIRCLLISSE